MKLTCVKLQKQIIFTQWHFNCILHLHHFEKTGRKKSWEKSTNWEIVFHSQGSDEKTRPNYKNTQPPSPLLQTVKCLRITFLSFQLFCHHSFFPLYFTTYVYKHIVCFWLLSFAKSTKSMYIQIILQLI